MRTLLILNTISALLAASPAIADTKHGSVYTGEASCSLKLEEIVYDVIDDKSVKIAKHGDNLMLDSPKGSVHAWCESGWFKTAITTKGGQLSRDD